MIGHFVKMARPAPRAPLDKKGVSGRKSHGVGGNVKNIPMEEFGARQSVTDLVTDMFVVCLYPNFLEGDDVVVRPSERARDCGYALMAIFRNVLQAPGRKRSEQAK